MEENLKDRLFNKKDILLLSTIGMEFRKYG